MSEICIFRPGQVFLVVRFLILYCMNLGIHNTFTFNVNVLQDPLLIPLLGIYFTFGDPLVIFTDLSLFEYFLRLGTHLL